MNPFPEIQQDAADAVLAHASFAAVPVYLDDGRQQQKVEAALCDSGLCVLVGMPGRFDAEQNAHKTVLGEVRLLVELFVNTEKTTANPAQLSGDLIVALVSTPVLNARNHFTIDGMDLSENSPGLIVFAVEVLRKATLNQ